MCGIIALLLANEDQNVSEKDSNKLCRKVYWHALAVEACYVLKYTHERYHILVFSA